jgi:ABC-type antimicrobial peptide transport system permease subunit
MLNLHGSSGLFIGRVKAAHGAHFVVALAVICGSVRGIFGGVFRNVFCRVFSKSKAKTAHGVHTLDLDLVLFWLPH